MMVRIEKFKFENRFESLETKKSEYAKVHFLDVNGEPV